MLDGIRAKSSYHRFAPEDFRPDENQFSVWVGNNHFHDHGFSVDLPEIKGEINFTGAVRWPSRLTAPGVMGWYGYVPGMQCYHGLVSLYHQLDGYLTDDLGNRILNGGVGYVEKDWGSSFPNAWVWTQSNHLDTKQPASLMVSVADIPWLGTSFTGFLSTFLFEGDLHTFATWTGAKAQLSFAGESVTVVLTDRRKQLTVTGHPAPGGDLASPIEGAMTGKINESLQAKLSVHFEIDGKTRYQGPAEWAGLEVTDNAREILT
ncbi:MAG: tocopherol cyclase family protein [Bacteroidota bacterium]